MSKITISAVLYCLRISISFVEKVIRLIYTVIDLIDDGCINSSVQRPSWVPHLIAALNTLESVGAQLSGVEDSAIKTEAHD